ncbi:MAG: NIL domain-containing protein [Chloroflexi bacterium]|nr:NIL domain-containing protein [Chloroflexota bacterium]
MTKEKSATKRRVKFTFQPQLIKEPVIWQLGHQFKLVTNIRRAEVRENVGWVILELEGQEDEIDRGIEWVLSKGVRVDPVSGDVLEG